MTVAGRNHKHHRPRVIAFDESDPESLDQLDLLVSAGHEGKLVPFVGAGISMDPPANLPSGKALEDPLKKALLETTRVHVLLNGREYSSDLKRQIETFRLEPMLEALQQVHGRQLVEAYLAPLNAHTWNHSHAILAALANAGHIRHCITLNFDCLLEMAFACYGASATVCPLLEDGFSTGSGPIRLQITKPHGSFVPARLGGNAAALLCGALSEIGDRPSNANRRAIRRIVRECPTVLVAGYSNHDWDISPILFELRGEVDHIIWIEHAEDPRDHEPDVRQAIIRRLLHTFDVKSTVIVAKTNTFLHSLAREFNTTSLSVSRAISKADLDTSHLLEHSDTRLRTAAATALILDNGLTRELLLSDLLQRDYVRNSPKLLALLTKAAGMMDYSDVQGMIRHMRHVAVLSPQAPSRLQTDDYIWLGYQYLKGDVGSKTT